MCAHFTAELETTFGTGFDFQVSDWLNRQRCNFPCRRPRYFQAACSLVLVPFALATPSTYNEISNSRLFIPCQVERLEHGVTEREERGRHEYAVDGHRAAEPGTPASPPARTLPGRGAGRLAIQSPF